MYNFKSSISELVILPLYATNGLSNVNVFEQHHVDALHARSARHLL